MLTIRYLTSAIKHDTIMIIATSKSAIMKKSIITLENYMSLIVTLGQSMHYVQAWKIFSTKSAADVSMTAYIICITLLTHWLGYGMLIRNKVLILAEGLGLIGALLVMVGILLYG